VPNSSTNISFINHWHERLLSNSFNWKQLALEAFFFQSKENLVYQKWLQLIHCNTENVKSVIDIPFLPIELFKTQNVICQGISIEKEFHSSGTTGLELSKHLVHSEIQYLENAKAIFQQWQGDIKNCVFFALLPHYLERSNSSLISMVKYFMEESGNGTHFYLDQYQELHAEIKNVKSSGKKIVLFGVTFALLAFIEAGLELPADCVVIETGGMKGRHKEMLRIELHGRLTSALKVPHIYSEYGMTELFSQCYTQGAEWFIESQTMKVLIREPDNPFGVRRAKGKGALNVIDLANIHSCCFIATSDQGQHNGIDSFTVEGRLDNSDIRGCNLLVQ